MPDDMEELKAMIDEAAGQCHSISHKAREVGHRVAETESAELADKLEQLYRQIESEYPE